MISVDLKEWETRSPRPGNELYQRSLAELSADRRIVEELAKSGRLETVELASGLELRATSFVGRFSLGEMVVTIRPKMADVPLMRLLRYAYGLRNLELFGTAHYGSSQWAFQDLLAQQLGMEVVELVGRGLHRNYERTNGDLASPRGRIDFTRYVRGVMRANAMLPCIHHPRTEDTLLNRILLSGLKFATTVVTDRELRSAIRRIVKILEESVIAVTLDRRMLAEAWRAIDRRTAVYESALILVELLLSNKGISLDRDLGEEVPLGGFLFDMNRFFQALISKFLHQHLSDCEVRDEFRLTAMFKYVIGQNPRSRRDPALRPDFVLMRASRVEAVLDAKYRDLWTQPLPREMLYQLALYALGQGGGTGVATILYPTVDDGAREQSISIHEPVGGSARGIVVLRPVHLARLERLVRAGWSGVGQREEFARWIAFGYAPRRRA